MLLILFNSFLLSVAINYIGLKLLQKYKLGQTIRVEGPQGHHKKNGTPTMGGIMIFVSIIFLAIVFFKRLTNEVIILLALTLLTGCIGGLDDWLKIKRGKNKGLTARQKLFGQFIVAALFCLYLIKNKFHLMVSPFLHYFGMNNPVLYVILSSFIIIGFSNAVNLTDGLDGLASGVSAIVLIAFAFIAHQFHNFQLMYLAFFSAVSCLGFLVFNKHPAKMFMGDVGSLALGTMLAGFALLLHAELYLFFIGIVFVIETLSVILQVSYFKLTKGKRIFKMSPLHHHFELCGVSERVIVYSAWLLTALAVVAAIFLRIR